MRLWMRAHHIVAQYVCVLAVMAFAAVLSDRSVSFPALFGGDSVFHLSMLAVLPLSVFIVYSCASAMDIECSAFRPLPAITAVHLLALHVAMALACCLVAAMWTSEGWLCFRSLLGFVSLGMLCSLFCSPRTSVTWDAVIFCFLSLAGKGSASGISPNWWNFLVADLSTIRAMLVPIVLFLAYLAVAATRR